MDAIDRATTAEIAILLDSVVVRLNDLIGQLEKKKPNSGVSAEAENDCDTVRDVAEKISEAAVLLGDLAPHRWSPPG